MVMVTVIQAGRIATDIDRDVLIDVASRAHGCDICGSVFRVESVDELLPGLGADPSWLVFCPTCQWPVTVWEAPDGGDAGWLDRPATGWFVVNASLVAIAVLVLVISVIGWWT